MVIRTLATDLPITSNDLPALYQSADEASSRYQTVFFRALFWHLFLLVVAATTSAIETHDSAAALFQALVLLGALSCAIYLYTVRPDQRWYSARAVAESIKTVAWRFAMASEPFSGHVNAAGTHFRNTLKSIIKQNRDILQRSTRNLEDPQTTESMLTVRALPREERLAIYVEDRVTEQQRWYAKKAKRNEERARLFFSMLLITNGALVCLALVRIGHPDASFWPTEALVTTAVGLMSWLQAKKFSELSASFALAAHEISIIKEQSVAVHTEEELSRFVGDAENAFSREHTQWVARKDE